MSSQIDFCALVLFVAFTFGGKTPGAAFSIHCNLFVTSALPTVFEKKLQCVMRNIPGESIQVFGQEFLKNGG